MVRKLVLAVAAASALMSSNMAQALGVGDINLRSALNQPLDAEIELLQVRDLSSQEILPTLASPDEFGRAGIERDFFLTDLVFTPVVRPDGRAVIRVTSSRPVREPFLNFLMEVRWPSGRVLREFTLLLDPPLYSPAPITASAPTTQAVRSAAVPAPLQRPVPTVAPAQPRHTQPSRSAVQAQPSAPAAVSSAQPASGEWRTSRTDTLWEIASRSRPSGTSVQQTMLAIQELNPNAFIDNNINLLEAGQNLTLPNGEQARRRSHADAVAQVAAQNSAWQTGQSPAPAQRQLDARQQESAPAAPASVPEGDALRLVAGSAEQGEGAYESASADADSQLRDQLDQSKEQLDLLEREKAEADSRLVDMQTQMDTLQRLLELKDAQLAALQEQLGNALETPAIAPDLVAAQGSAADLLADSEAQELPAVDETDLPVEELDAPAESLAAIPADTASAVELDETIADADQGGVPDSEVVTAEAAPVALVAEPEAEEQRGVEALLQRMMQNQTFLMVGGAIFLLLLLLLLMAVARRNARREAEMADTFIARSAHQDDISEPGDTEAFNVALAGFDQAQQSEELGISHDPITEADALIAYGKLAEAAEVLNAAIDYEPQRTDLRFKLMEVDALLEDPEGYANEVAALRNLGAAEPQIAAMHARFPAMAAALAAGAMMADDAVTQGSAPVASDPQSEAIAEADELDAFEFDLAGFEPDDEVTDSAPVAAESEQDLDLDFDLDDSLAKDLADPGTDASFSHTAEDDFELDFNLDELSPPANVETQSDFILDEDFDLSLTDDLQADDLKADDLKADDLKADSLMAEMDAMGQTNEDYSGQADTLAATDTAESDTSLAISDEDLLRFEEELNSAGSEEAGLAHAATVDAEQAIAEPATWAGMDPDSQDEFEVQPSSTAEQVLADSMADDDEDDFDFLSGTDECATKLDLARAYVDMGDQEGARDILAEVLDEGNEHQQQDAREMMEQLG